VEKAVSFDQLEESMERVSECIGAIPGATDMTGATASTAGTHGLVPQPAAGDNNKFLRGDGTWANTNSTVYVISATQPSDTSLIWIKPL
jgi:hypothetical protein